MDVEVRERLTEVRVEIEVELELARAHMLAMVEPLTDEEFRWLPARAKPTAVAWHFGHVGVEELRALGRAGIRAEPPTGYDHFFGFAQMEAPNPTFPPKVEVEAFVRGTRAAFLQLVDRVFVHHPDQVPALAELVRQVINHEYSHTKYVRRLLGEMGRANAFAPSTRLALPDPDAVAPPQYAIARWPSLER